MKAFARLEQYGRQLQQRAAVAVTGLALRHLGSKRPYQGEVEEVLRRDHKTSTRRLGLHRHAAWRERFRRQWLKIYRGS
jgi:hypothetical protein